MQILLATPEMTLARLITCITIYCKKIDITGVNQQKKNVKCHQTSDRNPSSESPPKAVLSAASSYGASLQGLHVKEVIKGTLSVYMMSATKIHNYNDLLGPQQ